MNTPCNIESDLISVYGWPVVQHLVYLNASIFESLIAAKFQVDLSVMSMMIVPCFGKSFVDVAPLYVVFTILKSPWLRYIFPASECNFCCISKNMQPLSLPFPWSFALSVSFGLRCSAWCHHRRKKKQKIPRPMERGPHTAPKTSSIKKWLLGSM